MSSRLRLLAIALSAILLCAPPAQAERRVALVIGIGQYENLATLGNPVGDAEAIAASLSGQGFEVFAHYNLARADFLDALESFQREADSADVALVYYAGHGMEIGGKNILAPTDMEISCEPKQTKRAVEIKQLFESLGAAPNQVVLLDACRNDPFPQCAARGAGSVSGFRGLQRVAATDTSLLVANATLSGQLAADGAAGAHSPFAEALLRRISTDGNAPVRDMLDRIARDVRTATGGAQVPEITTQGGAPEICIGPCGAEPAEVARTDAGAGSALPDNGELARIRDMVEEMDRRSRADPPADANPADKGAYEDALAVNTCGAFEAFTRAYPDSFYAELAKERAKVVCAAPEQETALSPTQQGQLDELGIICANCEEQQQAAMTPESLPDRDYNTGFIFPDSSDRRLRRADLAGLSARDLRIARNEIYARNGRFFNSADLRRHFQQFSWYQPHSQEVSLNAVEKANVALLQAEEKRR